MKQRRQMVWVVGCVLFGIAVALLGLMNATQFVHLTSSQTPKPPYTALASLIMAPDCSRTCLSGVEPGLTSYQEISDLLNQRGITFAEKPGDMGVGPFFTFKDSKFAFLGGEAEANIVIHNGLVIDIFFGPVDYCSSDLLDSLGYPTAYAADDNSYELYYDELSLIAYLNPQKPAHLSSIRLMENRRFQIFREDSPAKIWSASMLPSINNCRP